VRSLGSGIAPRTLVSVQSLVQARAEWGNMKPVRSGTRRSSICSSGALARDLDDPSKLTGQREDRQNCNNISGDGYQSLTMSTRNDAVGFSCLHVHIPQCRRSRRAPTFGTYLSTPGRRV
jgi:hypothetical protein